MNKKLLMTLSALAASAALLLSGCSSNNASKPVDGDTDAARVSDIDLVEDGKLYVTFGPYMPFSAEENGQAVGMDGDIINEMADRMGLDIKLVVTDFPGMLSGVQTHRADVAIGTINWTEDRTKMASYTDDNYYNPPAVGGPSDANYKTIDDLEGKRVCTVTGYAYADVIPEIKDAKEALFPRMEDVVEEFAAGRCDAILLDPMVVAYTSKQRSDIDLKTFYIDAPTADQIKERPGLVAMEPAITGFLTANQDIADALTEQMRDLYAEGWMDEKITEYGGDPDSYLQAQASVWERRIGVDREEGWTPPSEVRNTAVTD